ncbi:MAG: sulfurtransferase [Aquificae bacterium]|nr:sulfurtransferase [Aquificota bacterium]
MIKKFILFLLIPFFALAQTNPFVISPEKAFDYLNNKEYIFIDTEDKMSFEKEHIKGAINIDVMYLQDIAIKNGEKQKCNYLPLCPDTSKKIFSEKGISKDKTVIIYYKTVPHKASYLWFVLYTMGFPEEKLKILDGGFKLWKEKKLPTETGKERKIKASSFQPNPRYDAVAPLKEVLQYANYVITYGKRPKGTILIDVRHFLEYAGKQPMREIKRAGHIPGAKFLYWKWFSGKKHTFKPVEKIKKQIKKLKINLDDTIILYCTIGNRSSFAYLGFRLAGAKKVKIYTGGWYEWGNREDLPIVEPRR